jgi:muramoyltetrapeptide carboxypeptidase
MRIRVEAPSSPFPEDKLKAGVARLKDAGHEVDLSAAVLRGRHAYLNGSDDERRRSLLEALRADVDVIWLARGGYGLTRILPQLSLELPFRAPTVIGFSDASALFAHVRASGARVPCVHGPLATTIAAEPEETFQHALAVLERRARGRLWPTLAREGRRPLSVEGWLFASNLCVLTHLVGTASMPRLDGAVVVLEEIHERPYRIDRMLTQLLHSGALHGVRAVIVGHLTGCEEPMPQGGARVPAPTPASVFEERLQSAGIPVVTGLEVGHQPPNWALPLGARVRVTESSLQLLEDLG